LIALLLVTASVSAAQQDKSKKPSPSAASCKFADGKTVTTDYSSPRMMGHKLFGGIVPYGEVWRVGNDQAATFVTDNDLSLADQDVPAGRYTLFAIPAADRWTLIISKQTAQQDAHYSEGKDLLRVNMHVSKTPHPVENFTIAYEPKDGKCTLRMSWENTEAWVDVTEKKLCWPTTSPLTYQCPDQ
jgi:hypothetical protein